jgi:hypothetical protein
MCAVPELAEVHQPRLAWQQLHHHAKRDNVGHLALPQDGACARVR